MRKKNSCESTKNSSKININYDNWDFEIAGMNIHPGNLTFEIAVIDIHSCNLENIRMNIKYQNEYFHSKPF